MKTVARETPITLEELRSMAPGRFGDLVKAVVDVRRGQLISVLVAEPVRRLTLDDPRHSRRWLVCGATAREVVVDFLAGSNEYRSDGPGLQCYFDAFAIAASRARK
jgi:hypothetical protein